MRLGDYKHTQCAVPECTGKGSGRNNATYIDGLCHKHYERRRRNGDLELHYPVRKSTFGKCKVPECLMLESYGKLGFCGRHYSRFKKYKDPCAQINHDQDKASKAETLIGAFFKSHGHTVIHTPRHGQGDLLVNGIVKIEVKSAEKQKRKNGIYWCFNIHRHGVLKELSDYYIFQFRGVPGQKGCLYAAFKSPLNVKVKAFTLRSMIRGLAPHVKLYEQLIRKP